MKGSDRGGCQQGQIREMFWLTPNSATNSCLEGNLQLEGGENSVEEGEKRRERRDEREEMREKRPEGRGETNLTPSV